MKYLKNINGPIYLFIFLILGVASLSHHFYFINTDIQWFLLMIPFYALFYTATWFRMINLGWRKIFFWLFIYLSYIDAIISYRIPFNAFGEDFHKLAYYPLKPIHEISSIIEDFGYYLIVLFYIVLLLLVIQTKNPLIKMSLMLFKLYV
tara:strand:+ start:2318 stop:2764 length:447 start_codon:yes stop_codon:yes gene_type:complete